MIFSAEQIFSDDQVITADAISTNVIDLGVGATPYGAKAAIVHDIGKGVEIPILIQVTTAFASNTDLQITVEVSAAAALTSSVVLADQTIVLADLVIGKQFSARVLPNDATLRYLGIRYNIGGSDATLGKITAGIVMGVQNNI